MRTSSFVELSAAAGSSAPAAALVSRQPRGDQSRGGGVTSCGLRRFVRSAARSIFLFLFSSPVFAQFAVDQAVDSARAPFSINAIYAASLQFENISATTGKPILVGTAFKITVPFSTSEFILADIAGNKTAAITVSSLRATFAVSGLTGWDQVTTWAVRSKPFTPFAIAAGQKVGCRYDMPRQSYSFDINTGILLFGPAGSGRLRCQPGVLASSIPAPVSTPPATTPPTATQPPAGTVSSAGSSVPPLASLTDKDGAVWALQGNIVLKNSANVGSPYTDVNSLTIGTNGIVRLQSPTNGYICLVNGMWNSVAC